MRSVRTVPLSDFFDRPFTCSFISDPYPIHVFTLAVLSETSRMLKGLNSLALMGGHEICLTAIYANFAKHHHDFEAKKDEKYHHCT